VRAETAAGDATDLDVLTELTAAAATLPSDKLAASAPALLQQMATALYSH